MSIAESASFSKVVADAGDIRYGCQLAIVVALLELPWALLYDGVFPVVATSTTSGQDLLVRYLHGRLLVLQARHEPPNIWVVLAHGVAKADVPPFATLRTIDEKRGEGAEYARYRAARERIARERYPISYEGRATYRNLYMIGIIGYVRK